MLQSTSDRTTHLIGIDLGGSKVRAAIADGTGTILAEDVEPTTAAGGDAVVRQLASLVDRLLTLSGADASSLAAIAVGSPGVVDANGHFQLAHNIPGLEDVPLADKLAAATGVHVAVENDVNAAALGEVWQGEGRGLGTVAVLNVGTGIGLGIVIDGQLLRGARGGAGEVAYLPIGADPSHPEALRFGALEVAAATGGLRRSLADALQSAPPTAVSTIAADSDFHELFTAAAAGDATASSVVDREARLLAEAVLAITSILDPHVVVMTGGIGSEPMLVDRINAHLTTMAPVPVPVVRSALGARCGVVGALAAALRAAERQIAP